MAKPDLEKLHPAERLKQLKELEQKKKQEIEEAQKLIRESEQELTEERKWKDKVPIPEVAKEELEGLSEEGKAVLKAHRGLREKKQKEQKEGIGEEETTEEKEEGAGKETRQGRPRQGRLPQRGQASALEETIAQERVSAQQAANVEYGIQPGRPLDADYTQRLSQRPVGALYQEITGIRQEAEEKGYLSRADVRRVEYLTGAVEEKFRAADEGKYSFSQETARAASLTQQIGMELQSLYKRGIEPVEKNWYKGR